MEPFHLYERMQCRMRDDSFWVFRLLVEASRVEETAVLVNLQQKVSDIPVAIGHTLQALDLVVDPLRDRRGDPLDKEVQDVMPLTKQF